MALLTPLRVQYTLILILLDSFYLSPPAPAPFVSGDDADFTAKACPGQVDMTVQFRAFTLSFFTSVTSELGGTLSFVSALCPVTSRKASFFLPHTHNIIVSFQYLFH